jgi:hypothetical protein
MPLQISDLTLASSLAGVITAVTASAGTFYKLGTRNWERLYKAKDKELQEIKKDPISYAKTKSPHLEQHFNTPSNHLKPSSPT